MKATLLILLLIVNSFIMGGVDANMLGFEYAVILAVFDLLAFGIFLMVEKKKSATSRPRNGQARKEHTKSIHKNCTPYRGGVSSGL